MKKKIVSLILAFIAAVSLCTVPTLGADDTAQQTTNNFYVSFWSIDSSGNENIVPLSATGEYATWQEVLNAIRSYNVSGYKDYRFGIMYGIDIASVCEISSDIVLPDNTYLVLGNTKITTPIAIKGGRNGLLVVTEWCEFDNGSITNIAGDIILYAQYAWDSASQKWTYNPNQNNPGANGSYNMFSYGNSGVSNTTTSETTQTAAITQEAAILVNGAKAATESDIEKSYVTGSYTLTAMPGKKSDGSYGNSEFVIPVSMLSSAYSATKSKSTPFSFTLDTPIGSYILPSNITDFIPDYNNLVKDKDTPISIKITVIDISSTTKVNGSLTHAVEFKAQLIDRNGKVIADVTNLTGTIGLTIPIATGIAKPAYYGVYKRADSKSDWGFVPAKWTDKGIVVTSNMNGQYVVAEYKPTFTDVTQDKWYYDDITVAASKKLVQGMNTAGTIYSPENQVTRAEFVTMIARVLNLPAAKADTVSYGDVKTSDWFYDVIIRTKSAGLLSAFGTDNINPNQPMLREEMAYVLAKAAEYCKIKIPDTTFDLNTKFTDASSIDSQYASYVTNTIKLGLMQGMSATTFEGKGNVTRAQAATILVRLAKLLGYID
ncbi:MAG: S-layer homology domain-containing protein [Oscillospiraceae bacterium]|nr:S-layer homology domain-containing protein [Oscillospiraceae bacterium]